MFNCKSQNARARVFFNYKNINQWHFVKIETELTTADRNITQKFGFEDWKKTRTFLDAWSDPCLQVLRKYSTSTKCQIFDELVSFRLPYPTLRRNIDNTKRFKI